jgi:hypothetical protein
VLSDGDISDDSTPAIPMNAPIQFIYETFVKQDLGPTDPQAGNPPVTDPLTGQPGPDHRRGAVLDFFYTLREQLVMVTQGLTKTGLENAISKLGDAQKAEADAQNAINAENAVLQQAQQDLDNTSNRLNAILNGPDCDFGAGMSFPDNLADIAHDAIFAPIDLGTTLAIGSFNAASDFVTGQLKPLQDAVQAAKDALAGPLAAALNQALLAVENATQDVFHQYLLNWIDAIDTGLQHWGELGLAISQALFDPQTRRDYQNVLSTGLGDSTDPNDPGSKIEDKVKPFPDIQGDPSVLLWNTQNFVNTYLLPMLGAPAQLGQFAGFVEGSITWLDQNVLNPVNAAVHDIPLVDPISE